MDVLILTLLAPQQEVLAKNITENEFSVVKVCQPPELFLLSTCSANKKLSPRTALFLMRDVLLMEDKSSDTVKDFAWAFKSTKAGMFESTFLHRALLCDLCPTRLSGIRLPA